MTTTPSPTVPEAGYVSRRELAARLGVSVRTLYRLLPHLPLSRVDVPGHPRWLRADVERYLSGVVRGSARYPLSRSA